MSQVSLATMSEAMEPSAALLKALHYAADLHKEGKRKGKAGEPYVNHVIEVAELLARVGRVCDIATLQAAILHDVVEDTEASFDDVERGFGATVRCIVEQVTDDKSLPKQERKDRQVEKAPKLSDAAKMVKIADKISNVFAIMLSPPPDWSRERRLEYVEWSARVVDGCRGCNPQLESYYDKAVAQCRASLDRMR
jgi:guanosine-3',5'-bis(diphosphate) 3'-pyrophosphohydrolase